VADDPLKSAYLLTGSDRPKVVRALARLKARFGDENVEVLSAEAASGEEAVSALNALGLFAGGGGRLVVVESVERWKKDDIQAVAAYLTDPVAGAVLALVAHEPPKSPVLAEIVAKSGQILSYDAPRPSDLPAWVRSHLERHGAKIEGDAARVLVEIVGDDLGVLASEAEKLAAWAGGETIERRDVEALAVPAGEAPAWALTDAWGGRDVAQVLAACESELERGAEPFLIAARLAAQVGLARSVQTLAEEGLGGREIAKRLKKHEFRVRKALAHAERYSRDELDEAVVRLAELDAALKGASRLAGELELERTLVAITRAVEPAMR
jgi:DNA polymerase-3 subunit delta